MILLSFAMASHLATNIPSKFSSPANGSDDLYGTVTNKKIEVYSKHNNGKLVWKKSWTKPRRIFLLMDEAYTTLVNDLYPDDQREIGVAIAVVICDITKGSGGLDYEGNYIVVGGSTVETFSYNQFDTGTIDKWSAEVGNSNVTYVYAHVKGEKWYFFEEGGMPGDFTKPCARIFFNHKFIYNTLRE